MGQRDGGMGAGRWKIDGGKIVGRQELHDLIWKII
jgi:hypothetical protein